MLLSKIRTRRGVRSARAADPTTFSPLVGVEALPEGAWVTTNAATGPMTGKPWDKRARAGGLITVIRTFTEEGQRVIRFQIRPMVSTADALTVLSSYAALLVKSHRNVIGRRALSERAVDLPPDTVPDVVAFAGYETVLVRGLRGLTLAAVQDTSVVSVSAYGRSGSWTWSQLAIALREQLALLATPEPGE